MCGRYVLTATKSTLAQQFALDLGTLSGDVTQRYNIAPTQPVLAIRETVDRGRLAEMLQWGLIPPWATDRAIGSRMINARAETLESKPAFRQAFKRRRCLLPATGFYEWKSTGRARDPYFIGLSNREPIAFAGLWESWKGDGAEAPIESCAIVTVAANDLLRPLHDRMPLILAPRDYERWLDPRLQDSGPLGDLLAPYPAEKMTLYPVVRLVNRVGTEGPELLTPADAADAAPAIQSALDL